MRARGRRLPVGIKLLGLVVASAAIIALDRPAVGAIAAVAAIGAAAAAGVGMRAWRRLAVPVWLMVALVAALQLLGGRPDDALTSAMRLAGIGMLAVTFTLTTPPGQMVAWVETVLTRLRLAPQRVFRTGLVVGLTTRSVDHLGEVGRRVLDARRARGLQRSLRAFAVPMTVEAARFAHGVGEALDARGIGGAPTEANQPTPDVDPYRMIRRIAPVGPGRGTARWVPSGGEMGCPAPSGPLPAFLLVEAMVQAAGLLLAASAATTGAPAPWLLAGLDGVTARPVRPGTPIDIACELVDGSSRRGRVVASATQDGQDVGVATVLMVARDPDAGGDG